MPGTKTAPVIDEAAATFVDVSLRWMDWTGDVRTDTYRVLVTATDVQLEAFAVAMQAGSNSTLYATHKSYVFSSVPDSSNALEEVWENVKDNLVIQSKNPMGQSVRCFVPSPVHSMFLENTDDIDPTDGDLAAILAAWDVINDPAYDIVGARFTSRRDINQQIKI